VAAIALSSALLRFQLRAERGSSRKEHDLPKGEREPEKAYRKRLDAARPSGFFRDALRTYAGMLSRGSWISLPASLSSVLTDVDGRGTDLGVFLAAADLLVLRRGDRLSLPRLPLVARPKRLIWEPQRRRQAWGYSPCFREWCRLPRKFFRFWEIPRLSPCCLDRLLCQPPDPLMTATTFNVQNLRGQSLLFRCLESGFVTTAPAAASWWVSDPSSGAEVGR
jgi:hypothetical protein